MQFKDMKVGDSARIAGYEDSGSAYRRKLLSLGLTPGTELRITRQAPMGDPVEIAVRGFAMSLRKAEADALTLEKL